MGPYGSSKSKFTIIMPLPGGGTWRWMPTAARTWRWRPTAARTWSLVNCNKNLKMKATYSNKMVNYSKNMEVDANCSKNMVN